MGRRPIDMDKLVLDLVLNSNMDEKKKVASTANIYILFSTQQEQPQDTFSNHITDSYLDLEICHRTGSEVSKSVLSGVANAVLTILFPDRQTQGIASPDANYRIDTLEFAGSITRTIELSPTESVLRKFIKLKATIIQS